MKTADLDETLRRNAARRAELGLATAAWDERLRNKGGQRTEAKRALLRRMEERARAAEVAPLPGYR